MKNKIIIFIALLSLSSVITAQTGGPGQPEFMQFKPVTATDLVNLSSGSFSYNIPLFEIGGYPCNISYQSGPQMDEVASMIGLGWNLNIGAITHTMRGLPDDFNGDLITRTIYMRPNITMGGNFDLGIEVVGFPIGANAGLGLFYNNYNGFGLERSFGLNFSVSNSSKSASANLGIGMKANSQSGVDLYAQPSVSLSSSKSNSMSANGSLGGCISVNSREGLKGSINASMSLSANVNYPNQTIAWQVNSTTDKSQDHKTMSTNLASFSASYSFSKSAEIPRVSYPFNTTSYTGSIKVGGEIYFLHPNATMKGYYTKQELSTNIISTPAYGFLYSDKSLSAGKNVLLDFNREKDQPYIKDVSKSIGIPFYTNDIYSVNAQGISGSFQLNRNDIGVIFDNQVVSSSTALNIGLEAGIGNAFHVGADISTTSTSSSSGKWQTGTTAELDFKPMQVNDLYQPAYFKNASDVCVDVNDFYTKLDFDNPVKVDLKKSGSTSVNMNSLLMDRNGSQGPISSSLYKSKRDPRTINVQYLTAEEASKYGVNKDISQYAVNQFDCKNINYKVSSSRTDGYRKAHHISEITSTNADGMRYVFGLPTYNITQEEVSFTLTGTETVDANGLVPYVPTTAWGTNGKDGFYEKTVTPAYVTSNLLTAVLSPDYVDVDSNGPSINDIGNYVKFNYINAGVFKWRTPYDASKATFNKAFLSDPTDNKASFVYGEKELWFIHSIESKTEVAEFYYDTNRLDGLGAVDNKKLYKLIKIKIFSKNERVLKGADAVAIRVIQFTQDYELCHLTKNSLAPGNGKLTLKQVAMYSGKSMREMQSPYKFSYGEMPSGTVVNPNYNPRNVNRWGNYQENTNPDISAPFNNINDPSVRLSNADFPYSSQDSAAMTRNAYAWNLTKIQLPSGGTISAEYEPHHYANTQDQRNMEMFTIEGFGKNLNSNFTSSNLYDPSGPFYEPNYFMKIKLKSPISTGTAIEKYNQLLYQYFDNTTSGPGGLSQYYYYKTLIQLRNNPDRTDKETSWEWISGYCKIVNVGLLDASHAYIQLKPVCINDKSESSCTDYTNPIAKSAFQFMRMNRPGLCYGQDESQPLPDNVTLEDFLETHDLKNKVHEQTSAFSEGFNKYARARNFANNVSLNKSFIRLYSPDQNKIIGGSRVKRVITNDNWNQLTSGYGAPLPENKISTIDYDYTDSIKNPVTNKNRLVSSGVTEYEPFNGGDENPLHLPSFYDQQIKMAPDNNLYVELPYNESLYPGANLIYSKVKVTSNITAKKIPGTGYQIHEFYTAKDFPVKTDNTEIGDNFEKKTSMLQGLTTSILGIGEFHDFVTLSQGFSIVLNDMHGKTKSTKNFNSQGTLVSSEEFDYALNKNLQLIKRDGTIYNSDRLGVSVSAICDSRTTEHNTEMTGVDLNLDFTILAIVPSFLLVPLPKATTETTRLNSVCLNKIIYKKGIQVKKTVTENGARISTENLLFDENTGNTLLTRTTNEFDDSIYSFHYPAHWIYKGLSAGYISSDLSFTIPAATGSNNTKIISNAGIFGVLNEGDEIVSNNGIRSWVTAKSGSNIITLQPKIVGAPPISGTCRLLRPGRRNLLSEEAGTVVTNYYPIYNSKLNFASNINNKGIINASMKQYADNRVKYCSCDNAPGIPSNPKDEGNFIDSVNITCAAETSGGTGSASNSCHLLCNSNFEQILNGQAPATAAALNMSDVPCWETSAADSKIIITHNGYSNVPSYSGSYFAELKSNDLYQTFSSTSNNNIIVSFAHRAVYFAGGTGNSMKVSIGPDGGPYTVLGTYTENNNAWEYYSSAPYPINAGSYRLIFVCTNGVCFLDSVSVTCVPAPQVVETCHLLCNSNFEQILNGQAPAAFVQTNQNNFPCWKTTAPDSKIEIWRGGNNGVPAYSGRYFTKLNTSNTGKLYQIFSSASTKNIMVSFAHRGQSSSADKIKVSIGPDGGPYTDLGTYADNNTAWGYYSVPYTINPGSYRLIFEAIPSSNGNNGNGGQSGQQSVNVFDNPYLNGKVGNWYPLKTWSYLTGRTRSTNMNDNQTNLRKDGIFTSYSSFFNPPASIDGSWTIAPTNWQWVEAVTIKDVNGLTLETKDVLNRYNSMLTGYKQKLITAESSNARQREIMYDGFEDWNYLPYSSACDSSYLCQPEQINWNGAFQIAVDQSHTGKFCGELVNPSIQISVPLDIKNGCGTTLTQPKYSTESNVSLAAISRTIVSNGGMTGSAAVSNGEAVKLPVSKAATAASDGSKGETANPAGSRTGNYQTSDAVEITKHPISMEGKDVVNSDETDESVCCTGIFRPTKGKKYIISAWVKEGNNDLAYTYTSTYLTIDGIVFKTSGNIIDGWQRIYGEFTVSSNAASLNLKFNKGGNPAYFDDIRIYPADGKMTTYVYDRNTQKLTFTCDENNYFTKYNYDGENNLQSINKETEQGVQTIKESRSSTHKN